MIPLSSRIAGFALLSCLALSGCKVAGASLEEKEHSFAPLSQETIHGIPLAEFLTERAVRVIVGPEPTDREGVYTARSAATAVPITPDGYMLTAAHSVDDSPVFVQFHDLPHAYPVRVVWSGYDAGAGLDLALIHIDESVRCWFCFAGDDEIVEGLPVVALGYPELSLTFAAGRLKGRSSSHGLIASTIDHTTPLTYGDSGGPLVALDGDLVGINVSWIVSPFARDTAQATRPDLDWLDGLIRRDRGRP